MRYKFWILANFFVKVTFQLRMTGGGFGGCTVTLLLKACVTDLIKNVQVNKIF